MAGPGTVRTVWSPGHCGIAGNEKADCLAKETCSLRPGELMHSIAAAKSLIRRRTQKNLATWWEQEAPRLYRELQIPFPARAPPELALPRPVLGYLIQCRTGHGDFSDYHQRFGHNSADVHCSCGQEKSVVHFAFCSIARSRFARSHRPRRLGPLRELLATSKGAQRFSKFLLETNFTTAIAPLRVTRSLSGIPAVQPPA